jgi:DNA (cytosine-5)-methyltransferase 1
MSRPLCLDLFCGAGGAGMGYHRAGYEVIGVDNRPQKRYPFPFIQADALEFLAAAKLGGFDLIHASPPCQGYSRMRHLPWLVGRVWPKLIEDTRWLLKQSGKPYVIENVVGAPLIDPLILCGSMFGISVYRHRLFECSDWLLHLQHTPHREVIGRGRLLNDRRNASASGMVSVIRGDVKAARRAMQIDWMTRDEICEAIPPAYTQWIGEQLLGV